jgi:hypothetical protein
VTPGGEDSTVLPRCGRASQLNESLALLPMRVRVPPPFPQNSAERISGGTESLFGRETNDSGHALYWPSNGGPKHGVIRLRMAEHHRFSLRYRTARSNREHFQAIKLS